MSNVKFLLKISHGPFSKGKQNYSVNEFLMTEKLKETLEPPTQSVLHVLERILYAF